MHIKKGDNVIVLTGKDKGKKGKIVRVFPKDNKVIIEGINMMKKVRRAKKSNEKSSIVSLSMPVHASNVRKDE